MSSRYCADCGAMHECTAGAAGAEKAEVAIERLRTQRDIEVARIQASAAKVISATEAEHSSAHAEGIVEGMESVLEAGAEGDGADGAPIVIEAGGGDDDDEPAEEPVEEPPPVLDVPTPTSGGGGYWDAYR